MNCVSHSTCSESLSDFFARLIKWVRGTVPVVLSILRGQMSQETWNREELYERVWNKPVVKVAEEYGVSDVAIAKVCRKLSVPIPGRGYWAKKEHGHTVTRKPLPKITQTVVVTRSMPSEIDSAPKGPEIHKNDEAEFRPNRSVDARFLIRIPELP